MKKCRICGEWKDELEFYFRSDRNRYRNECKKCGNEHRSKYMRKCYEKNKKQQKKYRLKNREKYLKYYKEYRATHKEQYRKYAKTQREKNGEKRKIYERNLRKNPKHRLNHAISNSINRSLKNGKEGYHWEKLVGYTLQDLMKHLEKRFTPEMTWVNYGSFWWIDHIIPVAVFNFDNYTQLDFKRCFALKNLRPLEKSENVRKQDKFAGSFQPNLKIQEDE